MAIPPTSSVLATAMLLLAAAIFGEAFMTAKQSLQHVYPNNYCLRLYSSIPLAPGNNLLEPNYDDMRQLAYILVNITEHIDKQPEVAMTIASQNMGWLYQRQIPKLTQMLLSECPEVRDDEAMMRSYLFIVDFLEVVGKETSALLKGHQQNLRRILEACKVSESILDKVIADNVQEFTSPDFFVYLDSEIESQDVNSPLQSLLVTIKLRLMDEQGKKFGADIPELAKLAAEQDPAELRRRTVEHIRDYSPEAKELFLQSLRLMRIEMKGKYSKVDPLLIMNLGEVEKITKAALEAERKK